MADVDTIRFCAKNKDWRALLSHMAPMWGDLSVEVEYQLDRIGIVNKAVRSAAKTLLLQSQSDAGLESMIPSFEAKRLGSKQGFAAFAKSIGVYATKAAAMRAYDATTFEWRRSNVQLMAYLDFLKFVEHPDFGRLLLETGDSKLEESGRGRGIWVAAGANMTGRILMALRQTIKQQHWLHRDVTPAEIQDGATEFSAEFVSKPEIKAILATFAAAYSDTDSE